MIYHLRVKRGGHQPWSKLKKANDQPALNWTLNKTAHQMDLYLLSQAAFPTGGLYFKNETWVKETKGKACDNNTITTFWGLTRRSNVSGTMVYV
ncbi:hypothetical protein Bca4012_040635 [Brassica carinata]|uniref:(rape) hypothetical protein n=1 Tax=Brassica napus TaxID=3708 RepID=A0A816IMZ2_BRANA|nr:unnamed protein product [Brassica napus]